MVRSAAMCREADMAAASPPPAASVAIDGDAGSESDSLPKVSCSKATISLEQPNEAWQLESRCP